ncbi:hypothetical protein [Paraburkholderia sp. J11-2]|uniref:hypothetical protein n=1 Tax=Paraburkholderia sp. J11-2 TaxID=2805431 RepID=UPI002AB6C8C6|nr:hypothetical protein [Paraburkholderia sp. J11-2]
MSPEQARAVVAGLRLFGAAVLVGFIATALITHFPQQSGDYASWVQAFGSIGAIFYAVSIADRQRREANLRDAQARAARLAAVRGITEHAVELVGSATEALLLKQSDAEGYVSTYDAAQFQEAFRVLQQIPMLELGTVPTVEGVTLIKGALSAMSALLSQLRTNPLPIRQDHAGVKNRVVKIQMQLESGRQKLAGEIIRLFPA